MKKEVFAELLGSAHEALEHAQGKRSLRTTTLPLPPKSLKRARGEARACGAPCVAGRVCALSERQHQTGPSVGGESPNAGRTGVGAAPHRGAAAAPDRERAARRGHGSAAPASTPSRATPGGCQLAFTVAVWWQFPGMTSPAQSCEVQIF